MYENILNYLIIIKDLFNISSILHHMPHDITHQARLVCMLRYGTYYPAKNQRRILTLKEIAGTISMSSEHVRQLIK